jgi:hypothetical protein
MSTAIVRHDATVSSLADVRAVAEQFAISNYFDAKGNNPQAIAQVLTKIMAGRELGYGPFASVNGIHVIQGKPSVSANMMAAAVKASGRYDYRVRKMDDDGVTIEFFEVVGGKRESLGVSSFTKKDADKAGTQNMNKFPRNMMFARAMSNGVKWFCPDVFNGSAVYVPEELGAEVDSDGNVIEVQATVVTPPATNGNGHTEAVSSQPDKSRTVKAFHATGTKMFGKEWDDARHWVIARYTTAKTPDNVRESSNELDYDELVALLADMEKWNGKLVERWQQHKAQQQAELDAINMADVPELAGGEAVAA